MIHYTPTAEEIRKAEEDFVLEVARIRERHRLRQLHGENYLPPVDWKALEEEDDPTADERFMAALESGRGAQVPWRRGE